MRFSRVITSIVFLASAASCAHDGTVISVGSVATTTVRAADQKLLSDAIDQAFERLDINAMRSQVRAANAVTAYLEVSAPFELPPATLAYLEDRAAVMAGQLQLSVLEVLRTVEFVSPEGTRQIRSEVFPEADARVLMLVAYAGVDEQRSRLQNRSHSSTAADVVLKGRFKGTFAVTPRKASFEAVVQTVTGESEAQLRDGQFVDERDDGWF